MKKSLEKPYKSESKLGFFTLILFGLIIGMAAIIPGLSGGILAIALGVYAPAIESISSLRKNFKQSVLFLTPLGIGLAAGFLLFGLIMKPLFENHEQHIIWLFLGLIIGSMPSLIKEANKDGFRIWYIIPFILTFSFGAVIQFILSTVVSEHSVSPLQLFIGGGVLSLGMIIPGISSSFILIEMGIYDDIISSFVNIDIVSVIFVVLGIAVFALASIKLVSSAFERFHGYAYYASLGFLLSTMISVIPEKCSLVDIILLILSMIGVFLFMKKMAF